MLSTSQTGRRRRLAAVTLGACVLGTLTGPATRARAAATPTRSAAVGSPSSGRSPIPAATRQLVVALTESWTSTSAQLRTYERTSASARWTAVGSSVSARLGPQGLRWGRGLHEVPTGATPKVEGDGTAPAGAFRLSTVFGYDAAWRTRTAMPYVTVGTRDLFVEDPASPLYNKYVRLPSPAATPWELKQRMRQNDPAHRLKVLVEHNTNPAPVPGAGSAIFLHIHRRDGAAVTAGCTALPGQDVERIVSWLRPAAEPVYVLLPRAVAQEFGPAWGLP